MLLKVSCVETLAEMGADGLISAVFYTQSNLRQRLVMRIRKNLFAL